MQQAFSPHPPPSPHGTAGSESTSSAKKKRPSLSKQLSGQSAGSARQRTLGPGSGGSSGGGGGSALELGQNQQQQQQVSHQTTRHHIKSGKHAKIVLPRNLSSTRNLAKLARQYQQAGAEDVRATGAAAHSRQRSHENDNEFRLPGSLDDGGSSGGATATGRPPAMRRNLTSAQLPRNTSHSKLKKNLSHGQLGRLGSTRNLVAMAGGGAMAMTGVGRAAPPSPGAKGKSKRARSVIETAPALPPPPPEKDLHEQEVELAEKMRENGHDTRRKVGFALGSLGDGSDDDEDMPQMEGSGLQEDEWEDQSGSASPETTRQNTANNSRRPSIDAEKPPDPNPMLDTRARPGFGAHIQLKPRPFMQLPKSGLEAHDSSEHSDSGETGDNLPTPLALPGKRLEDEIILQRTETAATDSLPSLPPPVSRQVSASSTTEHVNPATKHLLERSAQSPAPALVSNISTLDSFHSSRSSPAPSTVSSTANNGEDSPEGDELVSRFIQNPFVASSLHASSGSTATNSMYTPKTSSLKTSESENMPTSHRRSKSNSSHFRGPNSPGSTVSGSSGAATPAISMSRTELRLKKEKFMADMEDAAALQPPFPAHKFDRRNESLKSYLNLASVHGDGRGGFHGNAALTLGPEIFQGRFKAINTELRVVQQFHDPLAGSMARLEKCKDSAASRRLAQQKTNAAMAAAAAAKSQSAGGKAPVGGSSGKSALAGSRHAHTTSTASNAAASTASAGSGSPTAVRDGVSAASGDHRRSSGRVTFSEDIPMPRSGPEDEIDGQGRSVEAIAHMLWNSVGVQ